VYNCRVMAILLTLLLAACCYGEFLRIEFEVREMDCGRCVRSLTSKFKRTKGVKDARLDPQNNSAVIELLPGNVVKFERIRDDIKGAGFTPKGAKVVVQGKPVTSAGKWRMLITGTGQEYAISVTENLVTDFIARDNQPVTVEGVINPPPDPKTEMVIELKQVR